VTGTEAVRAFHHRSVAARECVPVRSDQLHVDKVYSANTQTHSKFFKTKNLTQTTFPQALESLQHMHEMDRLHRQH